MKLLTLREVLASTGIARATLFRLRQRGEFPEPVRLTDSSRHVAWRSDAVDAWIARHGTAGRVHRDP